jgi:hypothetical protein
MRLRRFAPALLAALVLLALASVGHTHGALARGPALAAAAGEGGQAGPAELGCALCAHGERIAHGASHGLQAALAPDLRPACARSGDGSPLRRVLLERRTPRAPPRIG